METYYLLGIGIAVFALLVQLTMLGLQAAAFRRHGHRSFLILCAASVLGFVYCVLAGIPYIVPMDVASLVPLTALTALIGVGSAVLAIWGTALLFKSYRSLAEAAARGSLGGA